MKKITAAQVLLYLGGLIIFLAVIAYVGINWKTWPLINRILAIFIPMVFIYASGLYFWFRKDMKEIGASFLITASLIFPFFLAVSFSELNIFFDTFPQFAFVISSISLVLYLVLNLIFESPAWSLLYGLMGYIFYYFVFALIKGYSVTDKEVAFLFLIPSMLYLLLGAYYEKTKGAVYAVYLYILSVFIFFLLFFRLAVDGYILDVFGVGDDKVGLSFATAGGIYLIYGFILSKTKGLGFKFLARYASFFYLVGTLALLGSFWGLGFGGKKPVYEGAVLAASLVFILGSAWLESAIFLYAGTIFLIIGIFDVGSEYFRDKIGWPLALFISGLVSMFMGYIIERLKRKGFTRGIKK